MAKKKQLNKITARFLSNQPHVTRNGIIIPPNQTVGPVPAGATSLYPGNTTPPGGVVVWERIKPVLSINGHKPSVVFPSSSIWDDWWYPSCNVRVVGYVS